MLSHFFVKRCLLLHGCQVAVPESTTEISVSAGVDHGREPCPYRILGDIGGAFGMGAVGGGIWHLVKGTKNSPSGARLRGGLEVSFHLALDWCAVTDGVPR